jgi:hypothetical protein
MEQRPKSTLGLLVHLAKLRLAGLGQTQRALLFATVLVAAVAAATFARCLFPACPTSSGCPLGASSASADSPCAR